MKTQTVNDYVRCVNTVVKSNVYVYIRGMKERSQ